MSCPFLKPHHCEGCFLTRTPILMANGCELPIEFVRVGDQIFSEGETRGVTKTFVNHYDGNIIALNIMGVTKTIHATADHEFWVKQRFGRGTHPIKTGKPEWVKAGDLNVRDYVGFPRLTPFFTSSYSKLELNIFGWWLAEGCYEHNYRSIRFDLGIDELDTAKKIHGFYTNRKMKVYMKERPEKNTITVSVRSPELVKTYREMFGEYCDGKRLPAQFLYYPLDHQIAFLGGLFDGDGHKRDTFGMQTAWTTTSPRLQSQIRQILFRLGHFASTSYYERDGKKPWWVLTFRHLPKRPRHLIDKDCLWLPIKEIEQYQYTGKVYNFEVENTHTYEVAGAKVKNCADKWRCDGSIVPFMIDENLESCFEDNYRECPNYVLGLEQKVLVKQIKLSNQKKEKRVEIGMKQLESILSQESDDATRLEVLKKLYRARLSDLHEYKAELRRLKGRT